MGVVIFQQCFENVKNHAKIPENMRKMHEIKNHTETINFFFGRNVLKMPETIHTFFEHSKNHAVFLLVELQ